MLGSECSWNIIPKGQNPENIIEEKIMYTKKELKNNPSIYSFNWCFILELHPNKNITIFLFLTWFMSLDPKCWNLEQFEFLKSWNPQCHNPEMEKSWK